MALPPHVTDSLRRVLGDQAGEFMVSWMDDVDSRRSETGQLRESIRADFAEFRETMRADFAELREEMRLGFARTDARVEKLEAKTEAHLEKGLREQTRFFFLAWSVLLAAIVGLYAR